MYNITVLYIHNNHFFQQLSHDDLENVSYLPSTCPFVLCCERGNTCFFSKIIFWFRAHHLFLLCCFSLVCFLSSSFSFSSFSRLRCLSVSSSTFFQLRLFIKNGLQTKFLYRCCAFILLFFFSLSLSNIIFWLVKLSV